MAKKPAKKKQALTPIYDPKKPVYIIGGGASLVDFNFNKLLGRQVLALNTAHRKMKNAAAMLFSDKQFYQQWGDTNQKDDFWRFKGQIYTTLVELKDHPRIKHVKLGEGNTGVKSILLAKALGAETVILLGFDGKAGHWHENTRLAHRGTTAKTAYARYIKEFEGLAKTKHGLTIINANEDSAITCFETMALSEALQLTINQGDL